MEVGDYAVGFLGKRVVLAVGYEYDVVAVGHVVETADDGLAGVGLVAQAVAVLKMTTEAFSVVMHQSVIKCRREAFRLAVVHRLCRFEVLLQELVR